MIRQKADKKKLYINIAALVMIFFLIGYLLLGSFSSNNSEDKEGDVVIDEISKIVRKLKYDNLKKIEVEIFKDKRYLLLGDLTSGSYPEIEKGNLNPFKKD